MLQNCIFRLTEYFYQHILIQTIQSKNNRQTSEKFGNHSKVSQIIHSHFFQKMRIVIIFIFQICIKPDRCLFVQALFDDIFQIRKGTAADKQNISGIYRGQRNHGILAVGSYRNLHFTSLQKFQHPLLNSFSAHITLVGIFLLGNLIDLINKDDSMLCLLHIIICSCKKFGYDTFDIVTNIACLCQRCRIRNRKRNIQKFCQCFYQIRFTAACRSDHKHV